MEADAGPLPMPEPAPSSEQGPEPEEDALAEFAALHGPALRASGVPERYWGRLLHKLEHEVRWRRRGPRSGKGVACGRPLAGNRGVGGRRRPGPRGKAGRVRRGGSWCAPRARAQGAGRCGRTRPEMRAEKSQRPAGTRLDCVPGRLGAA